MAATIVEATSISVCVVGGSLQSELLNHELASIVFVCIY